MPRVSPACTEAEIQPVGGCGQEGAGCGVLVGVDVLVAVGESTGIGAVNVAVSGTGVAGKVAVASSGAGL